MKSFKKIQNLDFNICKLHDSKNIKEGKKKIDALSKKQPRVNRAKELQNSKKETSWVETADFCGQQKTR